MFPEYYLVRVNAYSKIPESPLDEWMEYLKEGKVKENTRTPGLQQVKEKLRILSMTPAKRRAYDEHIDNIRVHNDVLATARQEGLDEGLELGLQEGHQKALEQGLKEGVKEGVKKVALNLLRMGVPHDLISQSTNLSEADIKQLLDTDSEE